MTGHPLARFARPAYFAFVLVLLVIALVPQPQAPVGTPNDKVNHILAFFTLAFLARLLWPGTRLIVPFLWLALFGGLIEVLQHVMRLGRDGEWLDFVADVVAVAIGLAAAQLLIRLRQRRGVSGARPDA